MDLVEMLGKQSHIPINLPELGPGNSAWTYLKMKRPGFVEVEVFWAY
jgi:hypothetical protein